MYKSGDYKAVCDLCGFDFMASELMEDYWGRRVCRKDFETRHPQDFVRPKVEKIVPEWTRPAEGVRLTADIIDAGITIDWEDYPNYIVYVAGGGGSSVIDVGPSNDATLTYATRVQIVRMQNDPDGNVTVSGPGFDTVFLDQGQGVILERNIGTTTWRIFGMVG